MTAPVFTGGALIAGAKVKLYWDQDATGLRAAPTFTGGVGGFVGNTATQLQVYGTASTRTAADFTFDGSYWSMGNQQTGVATS